jgi:hypothetical protein
MAILNVVIMKNTINSQTTVSQWTRVTIHGTPDTPQTRSIHLPTEPSMAMVTFGRRAAGACQIWSLSPKYNPAIHQRMAITMKNHFRLQNTNSMVVCMAARQPTHRLIRPWLRYLSLSRVFFRGSFTTYVSTYWEFRMPRYYILNCPDFRYYKNAGSFIYIHHLIVHRTLSLGRTNVESKAFRPIVRCHCMTLRGIQYAACK